ncbi:MAG: hypothetical protein JNL69_00690 [Bacteroidia bacterium]|nr:hypothetical protein [Bacteroidia bacterium]
MPKIELDDNRICKECKKFQTHTPECSFVTIEILRQLLDNYRKNIEQRIKTQKTHWNTWDRLRKETERWRGKYMIVKHENNELRKQLNNLK